MHSSFFVLPNAKENGSLAVIERSLNRIFHKVCE